MHSLIMEYIYQMNHLMHLEKILLLSEKLIIVSIKEITMHKKEII